MQKAVLLASIFFAATVGAAQYNAPQNLSQPSNPNEIKGNLTTTAPIQSTARTEDRFITGTDQTLGSQIRDKLANLVGQTEAKDIVLTVDAGHVKLQGKVPSEELKSQITQNLQQINGVKSVTNRLEVSRARTTFHRP